MDPRLDAVAALLSSRATSLYHWLQLHAPSRSDTLSDPTKSREALINNSLTGAGTRFAQNWYELLPWQRERVVDRLLAAYCTTRTPHEDFLWDKLNYQQLRRAVGFMEIPKESALAVMDTQAAPYVQVSNLVRDIRNLCIDSRRTDALNSSTTWEKAFLGPAGVTRGKLYRLERPVSQRVVHEVRELYAQVRKRLPTGDAIDDVLVSADVVLARAHDSLQPASTRFSAFVGFLEDLIKLYESYPAHKADAAALRVVRESFEKLMRVAEVPTVVERRTAEVHFSMLSIDQQVQAVARARALLYHACGQTYALRPLLDVQHVQAELLNALEQPQLMRLVRDVRAADVQQRH
ncbi:uncharacterized protein RHOBADRAFT_45354 [Rhodotorula graminis WP1]|uniref:Uncharacterized protein n=1 Tax=Rhodotorula graminis (strain WP1) TaxID=578459 RepID=A0A0P9EK57_RHOGW|nr:uncharacterized protein RHOBADRAFT_45354 [Rhodotorula graminis WP1]KPV74058.1 hypothetical protein RHOBADRAFT_45354 [Rhodotorula graminis WP1]